MSEEATTEMTVSAVGTAKWLAAAAGGLAAALAAGLQFTGLAEARDPWLAVLAFCGGLGSAAIVIGFASRVILPAYDSLAGLSELQTELRQKAAQRTTPWPVPNPSEIDRFATLDPMFATMQSFSRKSPDELLYELATAKPNATESALNAVRRMLDACNAYRARQRYRDLQRALVGAGVLLAISLPAFAFSISPPDDPEVSEPTAVTMFVHEPTNGLDTDGCEWSSGLNGLAVDGTFEEPVVRVGAQKGCPGITLTLDADDRYVLTEK